MKAEELKNLYASVSALPTAQEQMAAMQQALEGLNDSYETLAVSSAQNEQDLAAANDKYAQLQNESNVEISRISKELTLQNANTGKGLLTVDIDGTTYTTQAGRKYQFGGKTVTAEELVTNAVFCASLIHSGSSILKAAE
jgi:hypothetical protein